jgi:hypothetical protein
VKNELVNFYNNNMETTATQNTDLILALIKAELRNYKLIIGLEQAGLVVDRFFTCLDRNIMALIGFEDYERDESLYERFDLLITPIENMEVDEFHHKLNQIALGVYAGLLKEKRVRTMTKKVG